MPKGRGLRSAKSGQIESPLPYEKVIRWRRPRDRARAHCSDFFCESVEYLGIRLRIFFICLQRCEYRRHWLISDERSDIAEVWCGCDGCDGCLSSHEEYRGNFRLGF